MIIHPAERTGSVQEYYFSRKLKEIALINAQRTQAGEEPIISLGIGSPDGMPPAEAVEALCAAAVQPGNHAYQSYVGLPELRQAFAHWYERWYGVQLDPAKEIQPLVGSKEGILLITLAFLNKGDKVLVPDPGYPTYSSASRLVEAEIVTYDLKAENGWQPDFEALEKMDLRGVKIMWTNYPGMPTGAPATEELYARLVDFGRRHGIMICNDNPYSFILNDRPLSILAQQGAKDCCLELNSLSKAQRDAPHCRLSKRTHLDAVVILMTVWRFLLIISLLSSLQHAIGHHSTRNVPVQPVPLTSLHLALLPIAATCRASLFSLASAHRVFPLELPLL